MKKIIMGITTTLLLGIVLTGCGAKEEVSEDAKAQGKAAIGDVMVEKEKHMEMKKNNIATFKTGGSEYTVSLKKAESTSDRTVGVEDPKEVIIMTYHYKAVDGKDVEIKSENFKITDKEGTKLTHYPGYRDYEPKVIKKGEECTAQMVWKHPEKLEEVVIEILDPETKETIGKWILPVQKRNYL